MLKATRRHYFRITSFLAITVVLLVVHQNCSQPLSGDSSTPKTLTLSSSSAGSSSRALTVTLVNVGTDNQVPQAVAIQGFYIQVAGAVGNVSMVASIGSARMVSQAPPLAIYTIPAGTALVSSQVPVTLVVQDTGTPIASHTVTFMIASTTSTMPATATPIPTPTPSLRESPPLANSCVDGTTWTTTQMGTDATNRTTTICNFECVGGSEVTLGCATR
jgi:hypothetical protein